MLILNHRKFSYLEKKCRSDYLVKVKIKVLAKRLQKYATHFLRCGVKSHVLLHYSQIKNKRISKKYENAKSNQLNEDRDCMRKKTKKVKNSAFFISIE